jgi:hypothetical protein
LRAEKMMKSALWFARALCLAASLVVSPHAGVADTVLKVEAAAPAPGSSGTMHFVDELRLSAGSSAPLVLKSEPAGGKLIPVPGPQYRIDDSHILLLGWSSYGGGMQTIHALLVQVDNGNVTLQHELMLTAARTASALIVRRDGPNDIRLGVGEPATRMPSETDWLLVFGPDSDQRLDMAQIRKLAFAAEPKREADTLYAPPFQNTRFPARVAWLSVSAGGFALLNGGR